MWRMLVKNVWQTPVSRSGTVNSSKEKMTQVKSDVIRCLGFLLDEFVPQEKLAMAALASIELEVSCEKMLSSSTQLAWQLFCSQP